MDVVDNWFQSIRSGNLKEVISIYKNNPDIVNTFTTVNDGRNHYQSNAIIEASYQGNRDLVKWLIDNNADVNSVSDGGWRPIHFAAQHGHVTTVNLLVLGGAEVNVKTEANETPILLALQSYMRDTVKKLMYHGASLVGIDRNYLHMWIQKDVLDPSCLDEENKTYLSDPNYNKSDINGYDVMIRQPEREVEEIKMARITKVKLFTEYDNDLRRRKQELVKKMRRINDQQGTITTSIRRVASTENDLERRELTSEALALLEDQDTLMPHSKMSDHLINLLELCICDSDSSPEFIKVAGKVMMHILQHNVRRGESAVVDFWCRIFDKMSNLQIEQYTMKILEMLTYMIESANDTVINNFKANKETFLKTWEYFFENLGFPKCLSASLLILTLVHQLVPESVNHRFHNVIDIMIGWCIHPETDIATLATLRSRSADLHDCWIADEPNLMKTIANLQKDVISHCNALSRIHRLDKDRALIDDLRLKIKYFYFALSCTTAGISGVTDVSNVKRLAKNKVDQPLPNQMILATIEKLCESMIMCSKQIDFDSLLLESNTVLLHLLSCLDKHEPLQSIYTTVLRYIFGMTLPLQSRILTDGSTSINYNTSQLLISNLDLIHFCATQLTILEPTMVIQIFSPANWIHSCLFYGSTINKALLRRLLRTVEIVIQSPGAKITFYQILLSDLELAINTLLKFANSTKQVHLVQSNAFKNKVYDCEQAELVVKYNLNMMLLLHHRHLDEATVLVPSIPIILLKYLAFSEMNVIEKYSTTSILILESVSNLIDNSDLINELIKYNCLVLNAASLDVNSKQRVFEILSQTLRNYTFTTEKNRVVVNLVLDCLATFVSSKAINDSIIAESLDIVVKLIQQHSIIVDHAVKDKLRETAAKYSVHTASDIRQKSFNIYYNLIDVNYSTTVLENNLIRDIQSISLRGRSFKFPLDFSKTIFNWIINGSEETVFGNSETKRLYDLVVNDTHKSSHDYHNRIVILYEIVTNACWDCVRQKLRFDQSADSRVTLMMIENIVKCILTNGNYLNTVPDKRFRKLMAKFSSKSANDQMLSINLIILLLNILEKMFYNAYEGCSVGLPGVTMSVETFFVTNKHVCSEWFIKTRMIIVVLAQYAGQWSTVVWHGMELLNHHLGRYDISASATTTLLPEMEDCIVFVSMALSKLGNWETLLGLSRMAVRIYGHKFDWIEALADKTIGHVESALAKFEDYIRRNHDPDRAKEQNAELRLLTRKTAGHSSFILCMEEIADCNRLLANVDELERWAQQLTIWKQDTTVPESQKSSINWGRISCLAKLSKWDETVDGQCTASLQQSEVSWKYRSVTDLCEDIHYLSGVEKTTDNLLRVETLSSQLSSLKSICDYPMTLASPEIILINERSKCLRSMAANGTVVVDTKILSSFSPTLPLSVINYCNLLHKSYQTEQSFTNQKYLIKWHRNQSNFTKSHALIEQSFDTFLNAEMNKTTSLSGSRSPIIQMQLERQSVKLLWATNQRTSAIELLTTSLKEGLLFETSDPIMHAAKCRINTKSLLTLFQWLSNDSSASGGFVDGTISTNLQFLTELAEVPWINGLPLVSPQQRASDKPCQSSVIDVCGQLLILASKSNNQDNNDKSFITLAQWCLSRSRSLDHTGIAPHQLDSMTDILAKEGITKEDIEIIKVLFVSTFQPAIMQTDNDWLGLCYDDDRFLGQLKSSIIAQCPNLSEQHTSAAINQWKNYISSHFSLHIAASDAYFSFLKDSTPQNIRDTVTNKNRTTANLRILSLLGKRSRSLRDSIINKLKSSPPNSWTNVIPQLFARIKHQDNAIRVSVTELMQRFAITEAHNRNKLIVYPTVVGTINDDNNSTTSPYQEIRRVLTANNATLVYEVEVFIRELRRITVLWDELWIASLNQCFEELNKKTVQLQSEIERITKDEAHEHMEVILQLKYSSIIQPALFILERVKAATNIAPETPRELWFYNTFNEEIASTINALKTPANIYEFKDSWKKVKELQELMITESNHNSKIRLRRSRQQFLSLKLNDISPSLAKICNSRIPIPGMEDIELLSIDSHISILPTKTKPKKLQFVASNGKKYNYLYKGLEDLRLDERIMQILGIANTMFSKLNERESNKYNITTYNVTPLGPRAGLIQMVEDATSLFTLYKRHQVRAKSNAELSKSRFKNSTNLGSNEQTAVSEEGNPLRPTDIYWQKLRPKLDAAKLDCGFENRDKWPVSILIDVLNELKRDTPSDLLSKELWCCSINSQNWFRSSIGFTRSCAVMSMMGFILGLGDRHLDNLLVNLSTGQIVHIDYNVCFDKGVSLKVPEKVPFRLTGIMTDVFGPAGVEGLFKISCENVIEMVQQTHDNILTLMDTFVLDPIVDWFSGIESGHYGSFEGGKFAVSSLKSVVEKRCVEFIVSLNNFQSVLVTMEDPIKESNLNLGNELNTLYASIERNLEIFTNINDVEEACKRKEEMIDYLNKYANADECDILDNVNYVKTIEGRSDNISVDLEKRVMQMNMAIKDHGNFFNMMLSNSDFISFKLDLKNLHSFYNDNISNLLRNVQGFVDLAEVNAYESGIESLRSLSSDVECLQGYVVVFEKYRTVLLEMPEYYYTSDRCSHMLQVVTDLVDDKSEDNFTTKMEEYNGKWISNQSATIMIQAKKEKDNWRQLLAKHSKAIIDIQSVMKSPSNEEEIQQLENIWQLTIYENGGINVFKAVLLEQYLEMANIASSIDGNIAKIPDQVTLTQDYNESLRTYLHLLNAHENYFKILSNCMNVFGMYLNVNEATVVCAMMASLHKVCHGIASFENNFIDIIIPESIKIIKSLSIEDEELLNQLQSILKESDNVLLHFNIALTSTNYDINNYEAIHTKTVLPIKERMQKLTDMTDISIQDGGKQLRVLVASFYTTLNKTYQAVSDFIDCCVNSSTPSSWNYLDLVAASGLNISPIWNKSHKLLKDAVYMTCLRALINTLEHCRTISSSLTSMELTLDSLDNHFLNMFRHIEVYFNFINRHILAGVGSQCFGKMFCLLLEFAGWNLDAMISENVPNCAISADYICGSVSTFRKTEYPNAINFYGQLQFRFNSYKILTGFTIEPSLSLRFLSRNISFHKSICNLAKNQLISMCWMNKEILEKSDGNIGELGLLIDLDTLLNDIPEKIKLARGILTRIDAVKTEFQGLDVSVQGSWTDEDKECLEIAQNKMITERNTLLASVRRRVSVVNEAMVNIDRFECLRNKSNRGKEFDSEVLQFMGETKHLMEELAHCSGSIKPIEEEIIKYKESVNIIGKQWWIELKELLEEEVVTGVNEQREQRIILDEIMMSYDQELTRLTSVLNSHYYPLISQLKPTLRALYSITRKLSLYVNDCNILNQDTIRSRLRQVCKLMTLFEKFNGDIEQLSAGPRPDELIADRLNNNYVSIVALRNIIVPDLYTLFHALSPLRGDTVVGDDEENINGIIMEGMSSSSNNNMAEDANVVMSPSRVSPVPLLSCDEDCNEFMEPYTGDRKFMNNTSNNSTGVQKAVEVWKTVESRLKKCDLADTVKVNQFVDKLIRSATNTDHLARMYEGWTAWV